MENLTLEKTKLIKVAFILLSVLTAYFAVRIFSEIKKDSLLGGSAQPATVVFSGHGEVTAVPDIATIYFTIQKDDKTAAAAQAALAATEKQALDLLKSNGVAEKDIKTENASFNPKYEYKQALCPKPAPGIMMPNSYNCGNGNQVQVGYTASESITVKIRKIDSTGDIMQALGTTGVSNLSGPNFAIDKEDELKAQARKMAIDDARGKAEALASDLGVHLGKIAAFTEGGNYPIMYAKDAMMTAGAAPEAAPAELPKGENTITSDVTITYEIR